MNNQVLDCQQSDNIFLMEGKLYSQRLSQTGKRHATLSIRNTFESNNKKLPSNKIKINHKRLPFDFFAMPASSPLIPSSYKLMTKCYTQPSAPLASSELKMTSYFGGFESNINKFQPKQGRQYKSEQGKRNEKQKQSTRISQGEHPTMHLTFSKHFYPKDDASLQKRKLKFRTINSQRLRIDEDLNEKLNLNERSQLIKGINVQSNDDDMKMLLSQKIGQLKSNRMNISIRKNNHPLSTLRQIKKICS